jgi:hypothetical protein
MGDNIRRLCMNVAFEDIWPKGLNFLTHERIVYLYIMYQTLYDYDYYLPRKSDKILTYEYVKPWVQWFLIEEDLPTDPFRIA